MPSEKSEVVVRDEQLPVFLRDKQGSRRGLESGIDEDDRLLPRVKILQKASGEMDDENGRYQPGELVNSISGEKYPVPLEFIPIFAWKEYMKWQTPDEGGKLIFKTRNKDGTDEKTGDKLFEPADLQWGKDNEKPAVNTVFTFLVIPISNGRQPVTISFAKTSAPAGKNLLNLCHLNASDMFSKRYELSTEQREANGYKFHVAKIRPLGYVDEQQYGMAEMAYNTIVPGLKSGDVKTESEDADF